jgi:hypothetical protein
MLLATMRISYINKKVNGNTDTTDSEIFDEVIQDVQNFLNSSGYGYIPYTSTNTPAPKSWPSFTTATLPSNFITLQTQINGFSGIRIQDKIQRIYNAVTSLVQSPYNFKYISARIGDIAKPPPSKNVEANSSVPVGIKVVCKLSDINTLIQQNSPSGIFDPTVTPAQYESILGMVPEGVVISIIDTSTGNAVWDPITTFRNSNTIVPFPNTTNVGTYIFYTNAVKFNSSELPIQKQSDKNIIDRFIYNTLDILVGFSNLDKSSSLYQNILYRYKADSNILNLLPAINSFKFQNIVYETYSQVVEDFQNAGTIDIYKLHNSDGTPIFTNNNSLYMGLAGLTIISVSGYFIYRFLKQRKFKYI